MKIAIVGSGNMGSSLGKCWAKAGHKVIFSYSRDAQKLQNLAASAGANARVDSPAQAVAQSDVLLLSVAPPALEDAIQAMEISSQKILISCVSGLKPDFSGQTIGLGTDLKISMAETIQNAIPAALVFEAFNVTFAEIIASPSRQFGEANPSIFYCGDDPGAKPIVAGLIEDCGYEAIDAGNLRVSRSLETLASAWVQFAVASQQFPNLGLKALRR